MKRGWWRSGRGERDIVRRPTKLAPEKGGPRINEGIDIPKIQLIDATGNNVGVVSTAEALTRAVEAGLDLVEIAPNSEPPVCKILDYGKYKYQAQKKAAEARKKQRTVEIKEIKMRPNIDTHDYDVKMRSIHRFFEEGDKVKVTLRFRGREMAHQELGAQAARSRQAGPHGDRKGRIRAAARRPADGDDPRAALGAAPHLVAHCAESHGRAAAEPGRPKGRPDPSRI